MRFFNRIPLFELGLLCTPFIGIPLFFFRFCPIQEPILDADVFGVGKIVSTSKDSTTLENQHGLRVIIPWGFQQKMIGQEWTVLQQPSHYCLGKRYKDGVKYDWANE